MGTISLACPICLLPSVLLCEVRGSVLSCSVEIVGQDCLCDPYECMEDVWEQAREVVFHI